MQGTQPVRYQPTYAQCVLLVHPVRLGTMLAEPLFSLANHFEVDADTLSGYLSLLNLARSPCGKINLEAPFKPDHKMKAQVKCISFNKLIIEYS